MKLKIPVLAHLSVGFGASLLTAATENFSKFDNLWSLICILTFILVGLFLCIGLIMAYNQGLKDGQKV